MHEPVLCPACNSEFTWQDATRLIGSECALEWSSLAPDGVTDNNPVNVRDANGTPIQDGETVTVIKDLKVKGCSFVIKLGTSVKNIRLVDGDHDIDCKIDGIGAMNLKLQFVTKA